MLDKGNLLYKVSLLVGYLGNAENNVEREGELQTLTEEIITHSEQEFLGVPCFFLGL